MNILCLGDIVGRPGRAALEALLPALKEEHAVDLVIVNAENAAGGAGVSSRIAKHILSFGIDVLTLGDHVWDKKDLEDYLKEADRVIRPANFPPEDPGKGYCIIESAKGIKVGVVNLMGRVFMRYHLACPFRTLENIVEDIKKTTPVIVVDMHAEATSEKVALGHFIDGKVSCVFGTHTHIQTADEKILPQGTAYITDLGMCGPYDSVIGQDKDKILQRFLTSMPVKFEVAQAAGTLHGVVVTVDETNGQAQSIIRIQQGE